MFGSRLGLRRDDAPGAMERACAYERPTAREEGKGVGGKRAGRLRWRTSDADMNGMRCHYRGVHTDNSMPRSANEGVCADRAKALNFPAILSLRAKRIQRMLFLSGVFVSKGKPAKFKFENRAVQTVSE